LLVVACLLAVCGAPDAASARAGAPVSPEPEACPIQHVELNVIYSCATEFTLRGSHGYRITVAADPSGRDDEVQLTAQSTRGGTAEYRVSGAVTRTTIKANFGRLGKIAVRFRPSGRERRVRVPRKCQKERPPVVSSRLGSFVGTIEFRGERGYTHVVAHSAKGGIGDPLANTPKKLQCDFRESNAERKRELESVSLEGSPANSRVSFSASRLFGGSALLIPPGEKMPEGNGYLFLAFASERTGRVSISRTAGTLGESKDFSYDESLTSATVRPPSPFTGTGTFHRNADGSTTWTGSLAVPLPGLGTVGLTGGKASLATVATRMHEFEGGLTK
jgi:hypothetical protein